MTALAPGTMADLADGPPIDGNGLAVVTMANVLPERVNWLWPGRIPYGKLTVLDGDPGQGKSTVTTDLAARVSTGSPLPTGERPRRGAVLLLSAEDGAADTLRPRLEAAGADLTRVHLLDHVATGDGPRPPELPTDLLAIREVIKRERIALVVVDPLMAFLAETVNTRIDHAVRRALHPLKELAEHTGAGVLVVRHLNKSGEGSALYRGGGSIGIIGAARSGMMVGTDPADPGRRVLAMVKHNLAPKAESLAFRLVPAEPYGVAAVRWEGVTAAGADELLTRPEPDTPERREAADFLRDTLASSGPAKWETLVKQGRAEGHSERTLRRARDVLADELVKEPVGRVGEPGCFWQWRLANLANVPPIAPHGQDATWPGQVEET